eukprot:gnl/TRDRNA2_/TRDRNA2_112252_c1_seq1.p1 gnl/TRDRNA2_/TRDRNA2_112252_c1~~gnl/TRDRNA2_/TRDRNA2_112252_c1_seq1.p1  ORF type:complete len:151 (+),score=34.83 gnl/TRDRNA2_/TRDRNA2_112252_c1_seq1:2-454(+)
MLMCRGDDGTTVKHMVSGQQCTRWAFAAALSEHQELMLTQLEDLAQRVEKKFKKITSARKDSTESFEEEGPRLLKSSGSLQEFEPVADQRKLTVLRSSGFQESTSVPAKSTMFPAAEEKSRSSEEPTLVPPVPRECEAAPGRRRVFTERL